MPDKEVQEAEDFLRTSGDEVAEATEFLSTAKPLADPSKIDFTEIGDFPKEMEPASDDDIVSLLDQLGNITGKRVSPDPLGSEVNFAVLRERYPDGNVPEYEYSDDGSGERYKASLARARKEYLPNIETKGDVEAYRKHMSDAYDKHRIAQANKFISEMKKEAKGFLDNVNSKKKPDSDVDVMRTRPAAERISNATLNLFLGGKYSGDAKVETVEEAQALFDTVNKVRGEAVKVHAEGGPLGFIASLGSKAMNSATAGIFTSQDDVQLIHEQTMAHLETVGLTGTPANIVAGAADFVGFAKFGKALGEIGKEAGKRIGAATGRAAFTSFKNASAIAATSKAVTSGMARVPGMTAANMKKLAPALTMALHATPDAVETGEYKNILKAAGFGLIAPATAKHIAKTMGRLPPRVANSLAEGASFLLAGHVIHGDTIDDPAADVALGMIFGLFKNPAQQRRRQSAIINRRLGKDAPARVARRIVKGEEREVRSLMRKAQAGDTVAEKKLAEMFKEAEPTDTVDTEPTIVDPKKPMDNRGPERGDLNVGLLARGTNLAVKTAKLLTVDLARALWKSKQGKVAMSGGTEGRALLRRSEKALNEARGVTGRLGPLLDRAQKLVGEWRLFRSPKGRAKQKARLITAAHLGKNRITYGANGLKFGESRLYDLIEGRIEPTNKYERQIRDSFRELIDARGQEFVDAGIKRINDNGDVVDFTYTKGGKIAPRIYRHEYFDIIRRGPGGGRLWDKLIDAHVETTGLKRSEVLEHFQDAHKAFNLGGGSSIESAAQAEFFRKWKRIPSSIWDDGFEIQLLETNPFRYAELLVTRGAARIGAAKHFGQDMIDGSVTKLRDRYSKAGGNPEDFDALTMSIAGLNPNKPLTFFGLGRSGHAISLAQGARNAASVIRSMLLSMSFFVNIPEPVGSIRDLTGSRGLARALKRLVVDQTIGTKSKGEIASGRERLMLAANLEILGARTQAMYNFSRDAFRPGETAARRFQEMTSRIFKHRWINEFQETLAGVGAQGVVERMSARNGKRGSVAYWRDVSRLKSLGFGRAKSERLAAGIPDDASPKTVKRFERDYDEIVRRAVTYTMGANTSNAERSTFELDRVLGKTIAFQGYANTIMRDSFRKNITWLKSMRDTYTRKDLSKAQRVKMALAATRQYADWASGKAMQGMASNMILALVLQRGDDEFARAQENWWKYALESGVQSTVAGPWGAIVRMMEPNSNIIEATFPGMVVTNLTDAFVGVQLGFGRYKNGDFTDAMEGLLKRMVPVNKLHNSVVGLAGSIFGLSSGKAYKFDTAKNAYWRYRFRHMPIGSRDFPARKGDDAKFSRFAKKAYEAMMDGEDNDTVRGYIRQAFGIQGKDKTHWKASINARRLLMFQGVPGMNKQKREAFIRQMDRDMAPDTMRRLRQHDYLVGVLAEAIGVSLDNVEVK